MRQASGQVYQPSERRVCVRASVCVREVNPGERVSVRVAR